MISNIEFPTETARPGEIRRLVVEGKSPIGVKIKCFTDRPPPPGYKACPECGQISIRSGQAHLLTVPRDAFATRGGELHLFIADADGDTHVLRIKVDRYDRGIANENPQPLTAGPAPSAKPAGMEEEHAVASSYASKPAAPARARCC